MFNSLGPLSSLMEVKNERSVLQPVRRRLSSQPTTRLVQHSRQCRIEPQLIVVDQILVAERNAENALC